jgi:hypothetical protein
MAGFQKVLFYKSINQSNKLIPGKADSRAEGQ